MQCCGQLRDITSHSDKVAQFQCEQCGKVGPPSAFPDPQDPEPYEEPMPSPIERMRRWLNKF